jgi:hypothetical protein
LEYYNGILFLTTNRVGTIDEAFMSRIHMSLYYQPLNVFQLQQIFLMNIEKLRKMEHERFQRTGKPALDIRQDEIMEFALEHCKRTEQTGGRWNGRQIRNAFQIVSSLARYNSLATYEPARKSDQQIEERPPVLDDAPFKKVETAINTFRKYMEQAKGYNDADLAHILGERADSFRQGRLFGSEPVTRQPPGAGEPDIYYPRTPSSQDRQYIGRNHDFSLGGGGSGYPYSSNNPSVSSVNSPASHGFRAAHATAPSRDGFDTRDLHVREFATPPYRKSPNPNISSERFMTDSEAYDRGNRDVANPGYGDMPSTRRMDHDMYSDY